MGKENMPQSNEKKHGKFYFWSLQDRFVVPNLYLSSHAKYDMKNVFAFAKRIKEKGAYLRESLFVFAV